MAESLQGHLLVATPGLKDPNFLKAIVLIVQHSESGALGLVLNRPTDANMKQVWSQIKESPCTADSLLYLGGPIEGPLVALHTREPDADLEVMAGLYYSVQPENLEKLIALDDEQLRFIAGYAGWGPGQLEAEIEQGAWLTGDATLERIFAQEAHYWEKITRELADSQLVTLLKVKHVPPDPSFN